MKSVKIGMGQLLVEGGEPERNLERAVKLIELASKDKCDIILLPETLDFAWTHPSALQNAEPIPGKFSQILADAASKYSIYVCAGLTEKTTFGNFNTAILIDNKGNIISKYSKINLLEVELPFYSIGSYLNVAETPFGKIGLNICADNYIDGLCIGHTLARMGADIILSPSSWTVDFNVTEENDPYFDKWIKPYSSMAQLFDIIVVGTTSVGYIVGGPYEGKKMVGCSLAVDKNGILTQGEFNEFTNFLSCFEVEIKQNKIVGTQLSKQIAAKGFDFEKFALYES